ncbi:MAG: hypothetical protein CL912_09050 [Deltaproteobacteria bacterium]|nr:hypothetical protein [Deltaproteobacteria bacterium]
MRRDATDVSHLSSLDVTPTTSNVEALIFDNSTCVLSPEGEEGPYCKFVSISIRFRSVQLTI